MPFLIVLGVFILIILLVVVPRRKKMKEKNLAILAEAKGKLEEVPIKQPKNITGVNSFIDENYVLFYCTTLGFRKYDIKQVKKLEVVSQRINGSRSYYLCFKNASGDEIEKSLYFASDKQVEAMQTFVQKYIDKIAEG